MEIPISTQFDLPTGTRITFAASAVRKERTGVHARLSLLAQSNNGSAPLELAWTVCNAEKDDERTRLVNQAHKLLRESDQAALPKDNLKHRFDGFCSDLWERKLEISAPEELGGQEERSSSQLVLDPFIVHEGGTLLVAPPGRGKSWLAILIAVSVDEGLSQLWKVWPLKTLLINLERSGKSVQRRIGDVNTVLGLPRSRPLLTLNARGRSLSDVIDSAEKAVRHWAVDMVVLDSLSRSGMGKLIEDQTANSFIDAMNSLCPTWVAIAHTPRSDNERTYGSIHFEAGADIIAVVNSHQEEGGPLGVSVEMVKANDVPKRKTPVLTLEFDSYGLSKVRPAKPFEFPDLIKRDKISLTEELTEVLLDLGPSTATQLAETLKRHRPKVSAALKNEENFVVVSREGRNVLYGARARV